MGASWGGPRPEPKNRNFMHKVDLKSTRKNPALIFGVLAWLANLGWSGLIRPIFELVRTDFNGNVLYLSTRCCAYLYFCNGLFDEFQEASSKIKDFLKIFCKNRPQSFRYGFLICFYCKFSLFGSGWGPAHRGG